MAEPKETRKQKIEAVESWLPYLKKRFPLGKPVRIKYVAQCANGTQHGQCDITKTGKSFVIELSLENNIANLCQWLIHEWAHARIWHLHPDDSVHPPEWGAQYARIWEYLVDNNCVDPTITWGNSEPGESEP